MSVDGAGGVDSEYLVDGDDIGGSPADCRAIDCAEVVAKQVVSAPNAIVIEIFEELVGIGVRASNRADCSQ